MSAMMRNAQESSHLRNASIDSDPYPNIIIYGDSEKLYGSATADSERKTQQPSSAMQIGQFVTKQQTTQDSNEQGRTQENTADVFSEDRTLAGIPAVIGSSNTSKICQNRNGVFSNESFANAASDLPFKQSHTGMEYKPPPSAPAGVNARKRIKLFTSLQPRPYKLVGDPTQLSCEIQEKS